MISISIKHNFPDVQRQIDRIGKQASYAAAVAINNTAKDVQAELKRELPRVFDRPTPYITNSIRITQWARRDKPVAVIEPKYMGGKGVDPQNVLHAEIFGGERKLKRSEILLQRAGILPRGYVTVPGSAAPLDGYGNIRGSFLVQLISYFQAFGEQGFRANMTAKRKGQLAKRGVSASGYKTIGGVEYFVSYGHLRGGRTSHLHPGIWSRSGIHGVTIKPVLLFVPRATYRPRFDFMGIGKRVALKEFPGHFEKALDLALRTAR